MCHAYILRCVRHIYYGVSCLRATSQAIYFKIHPDIAVKSLWIRYFSRVAAYHFLMDGIHCLTQCFTQCLTQCLTQCHTQYHTGHFFTRSCHTLMDGVQSFEDLYGTGQYKSPSGVLNEYLSKQVSSFHESPFSTMENFRCRVAPALVQPVVPGIPHNISPSIYR